MKKLIPLLALALFACSKKPAGGPPPGFAINVRAASAVVQPIEEKISLVASLSANEVVDIQSKIEGTIMKINFEEGEPVEKKRLLFELDPGKLAAQLALAEANFKMMESNRQRAENMLSNHTIAQQEYDQAIANFDASKASVDVARQLLKDARIYAEFDGITGSRLVSAGQVVQPQTLLTRLVDIDPIKIEFQVPERFLSELSIGQNVEFKVAAYPAEPFAGEVYFIAPEVDVKTRTVLVKARAANADRKLRPGMFGNLYLITHIRDKAVVVPETAVLAQGDTTSVYIIDAEGKAQQVQVVVGTRLAGQVEIATGLQGGEMVITEGLQKVRPGAPVKNQAETAPAP